MLNERWNECVCESMMPLRKRTASSIPLDKMIRGVGVGVGVGTGRKKSIRV